MTQAGSKFTVNDWQASAPGQRQELLNGELVTQPEPTPRQEQVLNRLLELLRQFVYARELGDVLLHPGDVILTRHDLTQPDIVLLAPGGLARCGCGGVRGAPALVVELATPANGAASREYRRRLYGAQGVQEYWRVDPERQCIEVLSPQGAELVSRGSYGQADRFAAALLPGFSFPVSQLFV